MNPKAKKFLETRSAGLSNATRYADGIERLQYDMKFVNKYIPQGGCCVDLCCGTGMMTVEMAKKASCVYAVDFNQNYLEQIPEDDRIKRVVSDANSFCEDIEADVITIFGAIQYNTGEDVKAIYKNCYHMLKKDGTLIISGQWGNTETVIVDGFSKELQREYFAEYRTTEEETKVLSEIGFCTEIIDILPERFSRFENTHFHVIVATKRKINNVPIPKYKDAIGIIGGMGSFATLDFFHRVLNRFPAEKEWDRPRIIIDNRCTMPSRVRAILYNENYDYILSNLVDSTKILLDAGADILVLACNTSHVFLEDIIKKVPKAEGKFVNIIESLGTKLQSGKHVSYRLLASEGTIDSKVYQKFLSKYDIHITAPSQEEYYKLREVIEDVKQDKISERTLKVFRDLIYENQEEKNIIIGCTEFPPVYRMVREELEKKGYHIFDPLESTIEEIERRIRKNE